MTIIRRRVVAPASNSQAQTLVQVQKPVKVLQVTRRIANTLQDRKKEEARTRVRELLKSISECDQVIDAAVERRQIAMDAIESLMKDNRIEVVDNGALIAEVAEKFSNQRRTVDPKRYRAKVTNDQFFDSVTVTLADAEKYLGGKELSSVVDVVPAKSLGYKLSVRELRKKGK